MYDIDYAKDVKTYCRGYGVRRKTLMKHVLTCFEETVEHILNEQISFVDGEFVLNDDDTIRGVDAVRKYIFDNKLDVFGEDYRYVSDHAFTFHAPVTLCENVLPHFNIEYCETLYAILLPHIVSEFGEDFIDFEKQQEKGDDYMMYVLSYWYIDTYLFDAFHSWVIDKKNGINYQDS